MLILALRRHYGLSVPLSWEDLSTTHVADAIPKLRQAYTTVNDIELYIGGRLGKSDDYKSAASKF